MLAGRERGPPVMAGLPLAVLRRFRPHQLAAPPPASQLLEQRREGLPAVAADRLLVTSPASASRTAAGRQLRRSASVRLRARRRRRRRAEPRPPGNSEDLTWGV